MMKRNFSLLVLLLGLLAGTPGVHAEPLSVVVAKAHPVVTRFVADAQVEAVSQAVIAAQVSGRVLELRVDAGQTVKKGDLLVRIDARESAEAVAAAEAQYRNVQAVFARTQRLVEQKFVSPAALDKARADLDSAAAARSAAAAAQGHAAIVAPISGIVARRHVEAGEMAAPGKPLLTLFAPGGLRVIASVPQFKLKEIRSVQSARVDFPDLGRSVEAAQVTVLPTVDSSTYVAQVRVNLPELPEWGAGLTPGMFARVSFPVGEAVRLTVPTSAVVRRGEVAAVYVQAADGRISLRQLRLGELVGEGELEVLAGLDEGEQVARDPVKAALALKAAKTGKMEKSP